MPLTPGLRAALACIAVLAPVWAQDRAERGFTPLFNGRNLDGWRLVDGIGTGYRVEAGLLVCPVDGGGNLFTEKEYDNFALRFEFKLTPGANNGIGIRAPFEGDAAYAGMEIQILDDGDAIYRGKLRPAQYHGSIYDVVPAAQGFKKPAGEWNEEEIVAEGRHIKVTLNGHVIVDANLDSVTDPAILSKHPGLARSTGHIGLLGHGSRVEFRDLRVEPLYTHNERLKSKAERRIDWRPESMLTGN